MKVTAIDHIGIAVADMDEALRFYCDRLGLRADPVQEIPQYDIRLCRVHAGPIYLELIEAKDWSKTMMRALPHQGPGVYHVGLRVDDVDACVEELTAAGVGLLDEQPREGEDMRISYLSPGSACGALVELVTRK
jgi:methylmalonyl-CoA/ethylmalonyl-CoA epimerase